MSPNDTTLVLIVDDEPMDIAVMRNILESTQEFSVFTATNYDEAVRVFDKRGRAIDLALIDVALPGKNGVELAKHLLSLNPELRVLFVSGHVGASVIRFYGINAGDEHFLQKPFESDRLLQRARQAVSSQKPLQFSRSASNAEDDISKTPGA